jgi:lysyl-tRNA synthetase class 1
MMLPLETAVAAARDARAWPFEEARRILRRLERGAKREAVVFETGYGPSGLPHIGTFGEVVRTGMVRHAFAVLSEGRQKTRLICFSDDMDGLRKVPDNVPNREMLARHLDKPLSSVPDPFGDAYPSFAAHNNARLRRFLDPLAIAYEFQSATECYKGGLFDATLLRMLEIFDEVMDIILPTLGPERRATYSPFLPISPTTGRVLQVATLERRPSSGSIVYADPDTGRKVETPVTGGRVKCQWKADWALRWTALGVDYEMCGKDLIDSVLLSSRICRALGGTPPETFVYELFLDQDGSKISKSRGNGLSVDDWLRYATRDSLSLFMYQKPKAAKKLFFDVIPKTVDEYLGHLARYAGEEPMAKVENPVWHIHAGDPPAAELPISFAQLLNLVSVSNAEDKGTLWGFIRKYAPQATPQEHPLLDQLVAYGLGYYHDFVKPAKTYRLPTEKERTALEALSAALGRVAADASGEELQNIVYAVGKAHAFEPLRAWFGTLYEVLLGQSQGPRFGAFIELYGVAETRALIGRALAGELVRGAPGAPAPPPSRSAG